MSVSAVDFLPADYHARRRRKRVLATRGGVTSFLAIGMVVASLTAAGHEESLHRDLDQLNREYQAASEKILQVQDLDRKKGELARRLTVLSDVLRRTRGAQVLEAVAQSSPEKTSLTRVEYHQRDGVASPEAEITIEGRCTDNLDIANFIQSLGNRPLLHDVELKLSEDEDASQATKKFVIVVKAPGQMPAPVDAGAGR